MVNDCSAVYLDVTALFSITETDRESVWQYLKSGVPVFVRPYFRYLCESFLSVCTEAEKKNYNYNYKIFDYCISRKAKKIMGFSNRELFDNLKEYSRFSEDVCIITADHEQLTIANNETGYKVYHLAHPLTIPPADDVFSSAKQLKYFDIDEGSVVFSLGDNQKYTVGDATDTFGAEAALYHIDARPGELLKVFRDDMLTSTKLKNVTLLYAYKNIFPDWVITPQKMYYADPEHPENFIGYSMREIPIKSLTPLLDVHYKKNSKIEDCDETVKSVIEFCEIMVKQVYYLSTKGIYVYDFNSRNIYYDPRKDLFMFVDTDSFSNVHYYSDCRDSNMSAFPVENPSGFDTMVKKANSLLTLSLFNIFRRDSEEYLDTKKLGEKEDSRNKIIPGKIFQHIKNYTEPPSSAQLLIDLNRQKSSAFAQKTCSEIIHSKAPAKANTTPESYTPTVTVRKKAKKKHGGTKLFFTLLIILALSFVIAYKYGFSFDNYKFADDFISSIKLAYSDYIVCMKKALADFGGFLAAKESEIKDFFVSFIESLKNKINN